MAKARLSEVPTRQLIQALQERRRRRDRLEERRRRILVQLEKLDAEIAALGGATVSAAEEAARPAASGEQPVRRAGGPGTAASLTPRSLLSDALEAVMEQEGPLTPAEATRALRDALHPQRSPWTESRVVRALRENLYQDNARFRKVDRERYALA